MRTSLVFLGVLSIVFIGSENYDNSINVRTEPFITGATDAASKPIAWILSISGSSTTCTISFISDSDKAIALQTAGDCEHILPGLQRLASISTDANGDITLYDEEGRMLAQFMESESTDHESIWPKYPLMTLARIE